MKVGDHQQLVWHLSDNLVVDNNLTTWSGGTINQDICNQIVNGQELVTLSLQSVTYFCGHLLRYK